MFHLWTIKEVYSNANGSVQFIELFTTSPGETQIANHEISSTGAANYVVPGNLSSSTANKSLLFATQGFADLGLVTPDFIIPDGFLSTTGGTLNVFGVDSLNLASLPTNGTSSLDGNGVTGSNSPTNFGGDTASIPGNPIVGTAAADTLGGTAAADYIVGLASNDVLGGQGGADTIIGGSGNDKLNGGAGSDVLMGGMGNDVYTFGAGDLITELANQGTDLVQSAVSHVLKPNTENLTLTGAAAVNGTGNGIANLMKGNGAANTLSGSGNADTLRGLGGNDVLRGGTGDDTVTGGAGADDFVFDTALNAATNVDAIGDFAGVDQIHLDQTIFTALTAGALAAGRFHSVPGATDAADANDRIIYDSASGNLFYDADGNGAGSSSILFASLTGAPVITAADFLIIP